MIRHLWAMNKRGGEVVLFVVGKDYCDACKVVLDYEANHYYAPNLETAEWIICDKCLREPPDYLRFGKNPNIRRGRIAENPPSGAFPIVAAAQLEYSQSISLVDAASDKVPAFATINRTKYAYRPGYSLDGGEMIGKSIEQVEHERIEFLDAAGTDVDSLLDFHSVAAPVLPEHEERKQLEGGKDDSL